VRWVGRTVPNATDGSVTLDWEGVSAEVVLGPDATFFSVDITDNSLGGARFAVIVNNVGVSAAAVRARDPNPDAEDTPSLRAVTLATAAGRTT
jgi:hypothetical protein